MQIKEKATSGLIWTSIDAVSLNISRLIIAVVLARLLTPKDFGILGMINVFVAISDLLIQGGFIQTLIRKLKVNEIDYSTIFFFNLFVSISIYFVIFFSTPLIASFYNEPQLILVTKIVALSIIFNSLSVIQNVILTRNLDFKKLTKINIISTVLSGIIGIVMAYAGFSIWSLVVQVLTKSFGMSVLYWLYGTWKPRLIFSIVSLKENFTFGSKIMLSSLIGAFMDNLYYIIIGKLYSANSLGYFYQARKLSDLPSKVIAQVFQKVSFPVLSLLQDDSAALNKAYSRFNKMIYFISFPVMALLIILAKPLFLIILTAKWADTIIYFQILCIAGMFYPALVANGWITIVKGRPKLFLKLEIFYKFQVLIVIFITYTISIKAMVIGFVIQLIIQWAFNIYLAAKLLKLPLLAQIKDFQQTLFIVVIIGFAAYCISFFNFNIYLLLFMQTFIFLTLYLLVESFIKSQELMEIKNLLLNKVNRQ